MRGKHGARRRMQQYATEQRMDQQQVTNTEAKAHAAFKAAVCSDAARHTKLDTPRDEADTDDEGDEGAGERATRGWARALARPDNGATESERGGSDGACDRKWILRTQATLTTRTTRGT